MVLAAYDLRGTALVQDFDSLSAFAPRTGFISTLQQQRKLGWRTVLMCEEKAELAEKSLLMSGLAGAFKSLYFAGDLDPEGMKKFGELREKDGWVVFVGDKAKDLRAARSHGISMVKVPEFSKPEDRFDFIAVQELLEAVILREFDGFREKHGLEAVASGEGWKEIGGEGLRIRVFPHRFEAQFTD